MLQVGVDLGIFKYLAESDKPLKVEELASKTGADPLLLCTFAGRRSPASCSPRHSPYLAIPGVFPHLGRSCRRDLWRYARHKDVGQSRLRGRHPSSVSSFRQKPSKMSC